MTFLRGCPTCSIEVSFISGMSRPIWLGSEHALCSAALLGPSPFSWGQAKVASGEPRPRPGLLTRLSPSPLLAPVCWAEAGRSGLASSSDLPFFFLPVFFFLVTLGERRGEELASEQQALRDMDGWGQKR